MKKDELERQRRKVQKCLTDRAQTPETRIGPNTDRMDVGRTDSLATLPRDVVRNDNQDNEIDKLEAWQSSNTHSEPQLYTKGSNHISRAMTSSFYEAKELKDLHKRFEIKTTIDV